MKSKYKITLLILFTALVISIALGTSYAFYTYSDQINESTASVDCFELSFEGANAINLEKSVPLTEEESSELIPYSFTIKNVCNHAAEYNINLETLEGSTLHPNFLRYKLNNNNSSIVGLREENIRDVDYWRNVLNEM